MGLNTNIETFKKEVQLGRKVCSEDELVKFHRRIVLDLLQQVVLGTPVDTGRARGGWQATIATPAADDSFLIVEDKTGTVSINLGISAMRTLAPFQIVWLTNHVPYIRRLEAGHSPQAKGWVRQALLDVASRARTGALGGRA